MAPTAPNIAGIWASDAETKGTVQMAPITQAAPMATQTTPRPIFSQPTIAGLQVQLFLPAPQVIASECTPLSGVLPRVIMAFPPCGA